MPVITMSRQSGSGAEEIANRLCEELGLRVFNKTLMMRVATEVGLTESQIVDYSEDTYELRTFLETLFRVTRNVAEVSTRIRGEGPERIDTMVLNEAGAISLIRATMQAACERGNVLIVGRGGQAILEDKNVLHVRVVAPMEERLTRVQAQEHCTPPQARRLIAERDRATREYLRMFYGIDVDDPTLYHLVLNAGKMSADRCVELIKAAIL